ncbi:aminotransferase class V-fold PLP-dependent enzyme [Granulosicoccus antarcticus]|uniref:Putative cysteine desulfurase n=1 Tax=Granulosicoccus antarcticus IMCC3135 TaxID=1192854 RepID=A0A2Z2NS92_9GAMM|nr:aminotransferase class V-fold PLP-dependent enzyme [Granulosicoccus antarcticus]ASJ70437.1 putative cysteine desulfurase [Granulosicoccus antarcticus IMCC3135]
MDITQIRRDTPGVANVIHLLASGSALMPRCVSEAVVSHIELESLHGGYEAAEMQADSLNSVYDSIARLIGATAKEIALLENATVAWCQAFYALPLQRGQRILTCEAEYAANYVAFLQRARRDGLIIDVIPSTASGELDLDALASMMDESVGLIAITWVPTNGGLVNPAAEVGKIARRYDVPYLLDACQAVGQMPVNVVEIGCDFLSATGRKFLRGPRGTGFLYVCESWIEKLEPVVIDHFAAPWIATDQYELRSDARRFENWENAYALRAGLGKAADYALSIGLEAIQARVVGLTAQLREQLQGLPGARLRDLGANPCAIASFSLEALEPGAVVRTLRSRGINIGASDPSSTRLDAERRALPTLLRVGPHYYNTEDEIEQLVDALKTLIPTTN